jgi:RNA polymerase sigma-70 factor (ECF subfamily)
MGVESFVEHTEPFRRELLAHCYRLLASPDEAEDLVQETYLRAWRSWERFEGRSSVRVWLYRIATNACLTALTRRGRRVLPSGIGEPTADPYAPPAAADPTVRWLQPMPDALVAADDPASVVVSRESLRLTLVAGLQELPGRQRAVFVLREVLGFPAAEVAAMLDLSVAAVKSLLQRARARLAEVDPGTEQVGEPDDPEVAALLAGYIAAFENADGDIMERVLRRDAALEPVGTTTWFAGRSTCLPYLRTVLGAPGDWRMVPTVVNGQPAAAAYLRGPDGTYRAFGVAVLTTADGGIARITVFGDPALVGRCGAAAELRS